ncbi:MAG: PqqD family protein [Thermoanaerobacteraceae bacterium]|nr:PqqD family protein [Thermoanaerobacteraceae bacterium]
MMIKVENLGVPFSMRIEEDETGLISTNGGVYSVDQISAFILKEINDGISVSTILSDIMIEYDVELIELKKDIRDLFLTLQKLGIISENVLQRILVELEEKNDCK